MTAYMVLYKVDSDFRSEGVSISKLSYTHRFICIKESANMEELYMNMQGERMSDDVLANVPFCEIGHTSMSVGDVVWSAYTNSFAVVDDLGFLYIS